MPDLKDVEGKINFSSFRSHVYSSLYRHGLDKHFWVKEEKENLSNKCKYFGAIERRRNNRERKKKELFHVIDSIFYA